MRKKIPANNDWFWFEDTNPKGVRTGDCVVRAIAGGTGMSWDEVLDGLYLMSKKTKQMLNDPGCYDKYLRKLGWVKCKQPRKDDNTKYTAREFCDQLVDERQVYICHIGGNHLSLIKAGRVHDTWDCSRGCVGNYWVRG